MVHTSDVKSWALWVTYFLSKCSLGVQQPGSLLHPQQISSIFHHLHALLSCPAFPFSSPTFTYCPPTFSGLWSICNVSQAQALRLLEVASLSIPSVRSDADICLNGLKWQPLLFWHQWISEGFKKKLSYSWQIVFTFHAHRERIQIEPFCNCR